MAVGIACPALHLPPHGACLMGGAGCRWGARTSHADHPGCSGTPHEWPSKACRLLRSSSLPPAGGDDGGKCRRPSVLALQRQQQPWTPCLVLTSMPQSQAGGLSSRT